MSTLQVANIFFDSSGNNKIVYEANAISFVTNAQPAFSDARIGEIFDTGLYPVDPIGSYRISYNSSVPSGYIQVTNTVVNSSLYPELGALLNANPYRDDTMAIGSTWTIRSGANTNARNGVAYGSGVFVSVGDAGSITTSTDGTTWTNRTSANVNIQYGVAYGNGFFVSVGASGSIQSSTDGITWTNRTTANNLTQFGVAYGNGVFVAVGANNTVCSIQSSTDAITWTNRTGFVAPATSITYGNGIFVVAGGNPATNTSLSFLATSANGTSFTSQSLFSRGQMKSVTYGGGVYVTVGQAGAIQTSTDAITWSLRTGAVTANQLGVTYANGVFVSVGDLGSDFKGTIQTSTNGITWVEQTGGHFTDQNAVTFANGVVVAVGGGGSIQTSIAKISYDTTTQFKTPAYNNNFSPYDNGYGKNVYIYMKT